MPRSSQNRNGGGSQSEVERYRFAAEDALQQLDWTIGYLHGIRKYEISKALANNRRYIRQNLMKEPDPGMPTEQVDDS